jgi:hypothetical protein
MINPLNATTDIDLSQVQIPYPNVATGCRLLGTNAVKIKITLNREKLDIQQLQNTLDGFLWDPNMITHDLHIDKNFPRIYEALLAQQKYRENPQNLLDLLCMVSKTLPCVSLNCPFRSKGCNPFYFPQNQEELLALSTTGDPLEREIFDHAFTLAVFPVAEKDIARIGFTETIPGINLNHPGNDIHGFPTAC